MAMKIIKTYTKLQISRKLGKPVFNRKDTNYNNLQNSKPKIRKVAKAVIIIIKNL